MKPAPFEIERPTLLVEALRLLAAHAGEARLIAGGQSLVPLMNLRMATPALLIDLNRVEALQGIRVDGPWLRIGAMTRQQRLMSDPLVAAHAPLVARAIPHVGHVQTRNRGTIGGSLAHADPSAELPVTMVALGAILRVQSASRERDIPAREFFKDILSTALEPDEVLVEVAIPRAPIGTRASFVEFARRHGDFAIASCAAQFVPDGRAPRLEVALGGVGSVPHLCSQLAAALAATGFSRARLAPEIESEVALLTPMSDLQADATLRRQLVRVALDVCLKEVLP